MTMCDYCRNYECNQPEWTIKAVVNGDMYCQAFKSWIKRDISMACVTPSFVTGNKSVTRRNWTDRHSRLFTDGTQALVWNKQARFGGEPIGVLELTENPFKQSTGEMTVQDYDMEGFLELDTKYYEIERTMPVKDAMLSWKRRNELLTVVPFKILEVFPGMEAKYTTDNEIIRCGKALRKAIG